MITPRTTRLHRVRSLGSLRAVLFDLVPAGHPAAARGTAVLVPTRSAAALLVRSLEDRAGSAGDAPLVVPDVVTRREWYEAQHRRAEAAPPLLSPFERDVLVQAAAHEAITEGAVPPFDLRPALVGEIRAFYDAIRRRQQSVEDFERLLAPPLEDAAPADRGAERLLRQTRFLAATFRGYERRVAASGGCDEHGLRAWLLAHPPADGYRQVIVTTGDQTLGPEGCWPADFDLLARLPGLQAVDVIATERELQSGLLERLQDLLPGILEVRHAPGAGPPDAPMLLVPEAGRHHFTARDREDELVDRARLIRTLAGEPGAATPLERTAVVFQRPLPYVYLARSVFAGAQVATEAWDSLPLAAEPFAAALDLVFSLLSTGASRPALVALLGSPHFRFVVEEAAVGAEDVAALDAALVAAGDYGGAERLASLAEAWAADTTPPGRGRGWDSGAAARAARAGAAAGRRLAPLFVQERATIQLSALQQFLADHLSPPAGDAAARERELRARAAVLAILDGLREAHARHDDLFWDLDELASTVRRWIESETFSPRIGQAGVQLLDAATARYADLDAVHLVGLVDGEWPSHARRNIFYAPALLAGLGWPPESDRMGPVRAAFLDLLEAPARQVSVSGFVLEHDVLVEPSPLLDEIAPAGLTAIPVDRPAALASIDEALSERRVPAGLLSEPAAGWLALRESRSPRDAPVFHGTAQPQAARPRSVSALELYTQCPFKFFARHVLQLDEEFDEEEGLSPLERGRFLHEAFEEIFTAWQQRGGGTITAGTLDNARALAVTVMAPHLARLAPADAAFERARLFGSPVAPGLVDLVLRVEAERSIPVVERRLEHALHGSFVLRAPDGPREVAIRGIADRIDLLADGTFRIIDYKSSKPVRPIQLAIYASCARQRFAGYRGRDWQPAEAIYLTFRGDSPVVPLARTPQELESKIEEAESRVVEALDAIAAGAFPPRPVRRSLCSHCGYAGVCRKEYVEDEAPASAV